MGMVASVVGKIFAVRPASTCETFTCMCKDYLNALSNVKFLLPPIVLPD